MRFVNREEAGKKLAAALRGFKDENPIVLALPRGGVVVGAEVALELDAPLGVILVRKIGHPNYPEYAVGAVTDDGVAIYNPVEIATLGESWRKRSETAAHQLLEFRRKLYGLDERPFPPLLNRNVIVIDDGIATGLTMEAAVQSVQQYRPLSIIVAVPVASEASVSQLHEIANEVVTLDDPENFLGSIGAHYQEFDQVDDETVAALLDQVELYGEDHG